MLEAALRSGYAVNYHCANGTCGDCRARILEGAVAEHLPFDYVFKGEDRELPMMLMCRARPASNMVIEVSEASSVNDIPQQQITTTVMHKHLLRDDVLELQLRTPRSQTLRFLAGQQVRLSVEGFTAAEKPIASCPCNGRDLMFHFFRPDADPLTDFVFDRLQLRENVRLDGPLGDFVLQQPVGEKILFIAYESGFAPIKSLIEYALSLEIEVPLEMLWLAGNARGHYLENQCRAWSDVMPNFTYHLIEIPSQTSSATELEKSLTSTVFPRLGDVSGADIYIAAPDEIAGWATEVMGGQRARVVKSIHV